MPQYIREMNVARHDAFLGSSLKDIFKTLNKESIKVPCFLDK